MSINSIAGSGFLDHAGSMPQQQTPSLHQDFAQLGQDLQAGNLTAAQADLTTLEQASPFVAAAAAAASSASQSSTSSTSSTSTAHPNPIAAAFSQLAQDLQSGNMTAAQQDYSTVQQDMQAAHPAVHHHDHQGSEGTPQNQNSIEKLFGFLGNALEKSNLSAAIQAYSLLAQDMTPSAGSAGSTGSPSAPSGSTDSTAPVTAVA
jgi:hypothetical protein